MLFRYKGACTFSSPFPPGPGESVDMHSPIEPPLCMHLRDLSAFCLAHNKEAYPQLMNIILIVRGKPLRGSREVVIKAVFNRQSVRSQ